MRQEKRSPDPMGSELDGEAEQVALPIPKTGKKYGWSRTYIYEQLKSGRIKGKKAGRRTLVDDASARAHWQSLPDFKAG